MKDAPLGLPIGSIRGLIVICCLFFMGWYVITGDPVPDNIMALLGVIIGFYFGVRTNGKCE